MTPQNEFPIVTLSNGLRVGNFSSPHSFEFEDGTILPACSNERAEDMKVEFIQSIACKSDGRQVSDKYTTLRLSFLIPDKLRNAIMDTLFESKHEPDPQYDILIVPLVMLNAMEHDHAFRDRIIESPFRVIRMVSRTDKRVCIDKFCV